MLTILLLIGMLTSAPSGADGEFRSTTVYDGHVTLAVPATWEEIPSVLLESHTLQLAEASGGRLTEVYQHGFRADDPAIDFALPECLIQIRESGRLNYRQFLELPSIEEIHAIGEGALAERSGPAVRGMQLSDALFDRDTFSLHLRNTLELRYEPETVVESVAFLTQRGLFTIHFYSRAAQFDTMASISDRVIDSVRFDDELRYRPRLIDRLPARSPLILVASAALIAIVAAVIDLVRRRRRQS